MPSSNDHFGSVRSLYSARTDQGQYLAQPFHEDSLHGVLEQMNHPTMGNHASSRCKNHGCGSWLRHLPLARSSCAKIRNLLSLLFNHACRHELFDRNPIRLVRQGAKRRSTPSVLTPIEIKALLGGLGLRERTLVLLEVSTGLRQSELFALKWGDISITPSSQ